MFSLLKSFLISDVLTQADHFHQWRKPTARDFQARIFQFKNCVKQTKK